MTASDAAAASGTAYNPFSVAARPSTDAADLGATGDGLTWRGSPQPEESSPQHDSWTDRYAGMQATPGLDAGSGWSGGTAVGSPGASDEHRGDLLGSGGWQVALPSDGAADQWGPPLEGEARLWGSSTPTAAAL